MRKIMLSVFGLAFSIGMAFDHSEIEARQITWQTNYDEAVRTARASSKPLLLFFTGSDWCTWCMKLEEESLNTPDFAEAVGDKFVFVKLDFPLNRTQPQDIASQNKKLQKQFDISGFPSIVILDPTQLKPMGTAGYRPGGGRAYGAFLLNIVGNYGGYRQKLGQLEERPVSGPELRLLYEQATELKRENDALYIAAVGVESDEKHFFLLERYRLLAQQNQGHSDAAIAIKQRLLASDPYNLKLTHYQVAVIDFETSCRMEDKSANADDTVACLVDYIQKFGENDRDNLWRLQMLISQVYFEKNQVPEALLYAEASLQAAPASVQPEIAAAIHSIETIRAQH